MANALMKGLFIEWDTKGVFGHSFGGVQGDRSAICVNCKKPLLLYITLDTSDPHLSSIASGIQSLRLLYCMRCALSWEDFSYRIVSDNDIDIIKAARGETVWEDWYDAVGGDEFPRRDISFVPIPDRLQELCDRLNDNRQLNDDEIAEFAAMTGIYAENEVGGYPYVDVFNQVGGRAYLSQRLKDPACPYCTSIGIGSSRMSFLASLTNDPKQNVKLAFDGVQIVFFFCDKCYTVTVVHSA